MSALREIVASFDVDSSAAASKLAGLEKAVSKVTNTLGNLADAFIGSAFIHGLGEFIKSGIEAGSQVNDLAERLGVGTDELQQFSFAAQLVGVGTEEAAKGLQMLNKNVGEAVGGNKEAAQTFAKLGISLKDANGDVRETGDLLPEIGDAFADMGSDAERTAVAMKIFGRSGAALIPLLKDGSKGLAAMQTEFARLGGGMSQEFVHAADEAGDEIDKLKFALNGWKSQLIFAVLPYVTRFAKFLQTAVGIFRKVTAETRLAKVAWMLFGSAAAAAAFKAGAAFAKMLGVLPKSASIWETLLGLGQIGLIIIGIAALVLILEDLYTWIQGGDSVTGDLIDSLFGVGASKEAIEAVKAAFAEFSAELAAFKPLVEEFGVLFGEAFQAAIPFIKALAKFWLTSLALSLQIILTTIRFIMDQLGAGMQLLGRVANIAGEGAKALGQDAIGEKLQGFGTAVAKSGLGISTALEKPQSAFNGAERPLPMNQQNDININITGVPDAQAAGVAARGGVRSALTDIENDHTLAALQTGS